MAELLYWIALDFSGVPNKVSAGCKDVMSDTFSAVMMK